MEIICYPQAPLAPACHERYFFDEKITNFINRNYALVNREELIVQCLMIGDESVGKSSLVDSFTRNDFNPDRRATAGITATRFRFEILGLPFDFDILDAAGSLKTDAVESKLNESIQSVLLVFDVSEPDTLENLAIWYDEVIHASSHQKHTDPLLFVVGTKSDLLSKKQLENAEIEAMLFANRINAELWSVSAATHAQDNALTEMFCRVATLSFEEAVTRKYRHDMAASNLEKDDQKFRKLTIKKKLEKVGSKILRCCNKLLRWTRCKKCDLEKMRK